jgi:hypothetical protein
MYIQPEFIFIAFIALLIVSYWFIFQQLSLMKKEQPEIFKKIRYVYMSPFHQFFAYFCIPKEDRDKFTDKVKFWAKVCACLYILGWVTVIFGLWAFFKSY